VFRKYFDRKKAEKRVDELNKVAGILSGHPARSRAILTYRSYWPKTPYTPEDDVHEQGFIQGYCAREPEVEALTNRAKELEILTMDKPAPESGSVVKVGE
jgi:hypothetical protein